MALLIKTVIFVIVSAGWAWLTRSSLRDVRSHGFYRFFAGEAILLLILLNVDYWFRQPFSVHQLLSWSLLVVSAYYVIHGTLLLHRKGKPDSRRSDPGLLHIEKTTKLVTDALYHYIRHPMYGSLLFFAWGAYFKHPSSFGIFLAAIATGFLIMTAKREELENIEFFGDEYRAYMRQSRMFVPYLF